MRIVAGRYGGRRLRAPRGASTRPTSDRVRESVFAILGDISGRAVLDLFAGSGALGLEALSRGAGPATFVERSAEALTCLRENAAMVDDTDQVRIVRADWAAAVRTEAQAGRRYGLCLIDPPYSLLPRISGRLGPALGPLLEEDAIVVIEHAVGAGPVELTGVPVTARTDRNYGGTAISVLRLGPTS